MSDIQLSKRGKILLLIPMYLMILGFLLQEPYSVIIAAALLSLFLYSRSYLSRTVHTLDVVDELEPGMKSVDESFMLWQKIISERTLKIRAVPIYKDGIAAENEERIEVTSPAKLNHRLIPKRRGYLKVGGLEGCVYDPMELYKIPLKRKPSSLVVVQSSKDAIRRAKAYARRSHIEELIQDYQRYTTTSGELEEIREYQPGDKLKDIHWRSASKFQKYMTKVYEKMAMVEIHILLDCGPSMRRKSGGDINKMEHSIFVALEILKKFEIAGHDIGLTAFDHKSVLFHQKPDHRHRTFNRIYEKMAELPSPIKSSGYTSYRYREDIDSSYLSNAEKEFSKRVGGIISRTSTDELAGIVTTVKMIKSGSGKRTLVVLITDLEINTGLTLKTVEKMKALGNDIWVIVPFSPWYEVEEPDKDTLEKTYIDYERLERILLKLYRAGALVFELYPYKEGLKILLEKERGKR